MSINIYETLRRLDHESKIGINIEELENRLKNKHYKIMRAELAYPVMGYTLSNYDKRLFLEVGDLDIFYYINNTIIRLNDCVEDDTFQEFDCVQIMSAQTALGIIFNDGEDEVIIFTIATTY